MTAPVKIALGVVAAIVTAAILYFGGQRIIQQEMLRKEIDRLRDELYRARVAADRCQRSVRSGEGELQDFEVRIAEMRTRVDSFEALDPRGVPEAEYDAYMEVFEAYNDSVAAWEGRERILRTQDASCRTVIGDHNALRDSLVSIVEGLGG